MAIPPPLDTDAEDVVWALQTAESLWKRDERADALMWVRRAAQAAGDAEDDDRALTLARAAAELTDEIQGAHEYERADASVPEVPPAPPPRASIDILIDVDTSSGAVADDDDGIVTSAPQIASAPSAPQIANAPSAPPKKAPPRKPPPPPGRSLRPAPPPSAASGDSAGSTPPEVEPAPQRRAAHAPPAADLAVEETITEWPPSEQTPLVPVESSPPPTPASDPPRGVRGKTGALGLPSRSRTVPGGFSPDHPAPPSLAPGEGEGPPTLAPSSTASSPPHGGERVDAKTHGSMKPPAIEIDGDVLTTPEPPKPRPTAPPRAAPPRHGPPKTPPPSAPLATSAPGARAVAPPAPARPLDLASVAAFADLPDDVRASFARAARVSSLAVDEEEAGFALAFVIQGEVDVAAAVVDTPAARLRTGDVLRARGTVESAIALRVIGTAPGARVALWDDEAVATAFGPCPWVEDELRAASDRFQALAGATMGLLADKLDATLRGALLASLETRVLAEGEVIAEAGDSVPGVLVVGVGVLELVAHEHVTGKVSSGEFLFPLEVLGGAKARATARAGKGGAVVLMGGKQRTQELVVTYPSLLEILAGM